MHLNKSHANKPIYSILDLSLSES
uniref:Uncharacterized protein n=1 Tax=Arundo donax TaxID=35708 RepID=A0A0A9SNJ2_ARUDO